jgi:hypothetical protein
MILKREAVFQAFPFDTKYHDNWLAWVISINYRIKFIDKKLHLYRQHNNQQVGLGVCNSLTKHKQKSFFQKYIYDFDKFNRRKEFRQECLKNNVLFYKTAVDYLIKYNNSNYLLEEAKDIFYYYNTRFKASKMKRLKRLMMLLPLLLKGKYKKYEPKRPFSEFRRDIEFPVIEGD